MPLEIRAFRCLDDNIGVILRDVATGRVAAIDAPDEAPVVAALDKEGWHLDEILVTHRHGDHVQGIPGLKERYGCKVTAPAKAGAAVPGVDATVKEGDTVAVGDSTAQVWETPGHCSDHVTYVFEGVAFAGDTLFTLGCGRVLEDTPAVLWRSLQRLAGLPDATAIYSGHDYVLSNARFALAADPDNAALKERAEEAEMAKAQGRFLVPSTLAMEKVTNPFLRAGEPALARSVHKEGADAETVFTALREWKNRF
ncbi:MAG TPA: hydroxyacylglutathione hydrolase [Beijerinckiaceae bacterium]|jgi:hydroxyacylglutathione hydrolase